MPRLSEEQKAINKLATKERNEAFKARRKAYAAELEAAKAAADLAPEHAAKLAAAAAFDTAIDQRNQELADIDVQIARLQAQREAAEVRHRELVSGAKQLRDTAWAAHNAVVEKLEGAVKARYPDMVNCWYPAQWQRPEGV